MEKLPSEITEKILRSCLLPIAPIALQLQCRQQCRQVCRTWRNLLPKQKGLLYKVSHHKETETEEKLYFSEQNNDKVSTSTTNHGEQLCCFETVELEHSLVMPSLDSSRVWVSSIVGSCNGLVCYAGDTSHELKICICNPVTGEHIQLPDIRWSLRKSDPAIGFGYVPSSDDYKVVVLRDNIWQSYWDFKVYSLRGGSRWRNKYTSGCGKLFFSDMSRLSSAGVFTDGALHWIDEKSRKPRTVAFDLECETFELLPSIPSVGRGANVNLMVLGSDLCVMEVVPSKHVIVWELRDRKTVKYVEEQHPDVSYWVTKFNISWEDYSWIKPFEHPIPACMLWYNAVLSCYDSETRTLRKLDETLKKFMGDCTTPSVYTDDWATPHAHSLISLKAIMGRKGGKKRKAPEEITEKEKLTAG